MCLDIPNEYILEYNQGMLNNLAMGDNSIELEKVLTRDEEGITSCIFPYIKKEWITGVYALTLNSIGDVVVLECNEACTELKLYKVLSYSFFGDTVVDVTKLEDDTYTVEDVLEKYSIYNGWECQEKFDKGLCLEFISKNMKVPMSKLEDYAKDLDESNVFESVLGIMEKIFADL